MAEFKLTEKSAEVYNFIKSNGGKVTVDEIVAATGRTPRSVNANITDICKDTKGLAQREVVMDGDNKITYVVLTDFGKEYVPAE